MALRMWVVGEVRLREGDEKERVGWREKQRRRRKEKERREKRRQKKKGEGGGKWGSEGGKERACAGVEMSCRRRARERVSVVRMR